MATRRVLRTVGAAIVGYENLPRDPRPRKEAARLAGVPAWRTYGPRSDTASGSSVRRPEFHPAAARSLALWNGIERSVGTSLPRSASEHRIGLLVVALDDGGGGAVRLEGGAQRLVQAATARAARRESMARRGRAAGRQATQGRDVATKDRPADQRGVPAERLSAPAAIAPGRQRPVEASPRQRGYQHGNLRNRPGRIAKDRI